MSLLHNEDFTIWQLRTSYLSTIKDGIGDRLINVNHSVLNTPGFRAAGWPTASANHPTQLAASIKRTYSPPIPTTTAVSSEYYNLSTRDLNDSRGFGFGDDGEDDEGGMVTGRSTTDGIVRRNLRSEKRMNRRQQREQQKVRDIEEEDSSDLSDESDDDAEAPPPQRVSEEIKFQKVPVRTRAGSSPIRATDRQERPQVMVTHPSQPSLNSHYRTGSLGTPPVANGRPRRDTTTTTTSSDMSSDHEIDSAAAMGYRRRQIHFSGQDQVIGPADFGKSSDGLEQLDEQVEDSDAGSVESALSSEFDATAGSASILGGMGMTGLTSSSPIALMHKLPQGPSSQTSSPRKPKTPAPEMQDLPPPRPISTIQPVSLLSTALNARAKAPTNPVEKFAVLSGKGLTDALNIRLYLPFSSDPEDPLDLPLARESKLGEQPAPVTVVEAIGLALWRYAEEEREPPIERNKLNVNRWALRMVEDGEVEYDFPALGRTSDMTDFTSNNNSRGGGMRARSRGKQYDEFALVEASDSEFEENERLFPTDNATAAAEEAGEPSPAALPVPVTQPIPQNKAPRSNPILGQPFSSALNDNTLTPADRPAVPVSHATPRLGVSKTLKIRYINLEASTQVTTLNTSTDSYIAEILDSVCKRWGLDKGNYLLKVMGSSTIAPLDRTVEALGNITELDLVRRRFGPQALTGSPVSSSPNAPLMIENPAVPSKKGKKSGQRMLHPLTQKQDLIGGIGGYYRRYFVLRKQSMGFTTSLHRVLTFDNDYMHVMPADTGKNGSDTKTRSISFNDVVGCKVSRRHPKNFRVVVLRGNDATEQKRYDFEARNALEAVEIVDEIKKNMAHYRT